MTSPITLARRAIWSAVNGWDNLRDGSGKSVFKQQIRFEDELIPTLPDVAASLGPGDLPTLAILTDSIAMDWKHTRTQHWQLDLLVVMWTPDWNQLLAEKYVPEIMHAIYAAAPAVSAVGQYSNSTVSFVKNPTTGTGYDPRLSPSIKFNRAKIGSEGETNAIQTEIVVRLEFEFAPFT